MPNFKIKKLETMKYLKTSLAFVAALMLLTMGSCSKEFLDRPPEDSSALDNFYNNEAEITGNLNALYGSVWFNFNDKLMWAVTEILSGNARTYSGDVLSFVDFTVSSDNAVLTQGWGSLWSVIAQSNSVINNLPERVGADVSEAAVNNAIAEARFMRAVAYFYLVRIWGPVPIIENNLDHVYSPQIPTNRVVDIYEFIERDLQFAIENLYGPARAAVGHVTSNGAKAMKAKVHLYQEEWDMAKQLSAEVINSGEFYLLEDYANLFLTDYNNNPESIVAMQWTDAGYGTGNSRQSYFAYTTNLTGTGDGWGVIGPTISLQEAFEPGDERRIATIMLEGDYYPNLLAAEGGFTVPDDINAAGTLAGAKKYVVGTPADNGGRGRMQGTVNNTYIMRYADVLLIYAEAVLGDAASTSDESALEAFNAVRLRAGLGRLPSITKEDIIEERRVEFALEGEYWFDLGRIDRDWAIEIISAQERGNYSGDGTELFSKTYTPSEDDFLVPYPSVDVSINPLLAEEPVPYEFN